MRRIFIGATAALFMAGSASLAPATAQESAETQPAQPNVTLSATHGAWEVHCVEGTEDCTMRQFGDTPDGERALMVAVKRLEGVTNEGQPVPAAMEVLAPLGLLIPYGIRLKVDQGEVTGIPLIRCVQDRCIAQEPLSEQSVSTLKGGATARFGFVMNDEVLVDISLNGFTAAYNSLKPMAMEGPGQN